MEPEARIRRMAEEGLLNDRQAQMLRDSFAGRTSGTGRQPPSAMARLKSLVPALVAAAVVIGIVLVAGGGGDPVVIQDVSETLNQSGGQGEMNRTFSTVLAISLLLIVPLLLWSGMHNSLVGREEKVFEAWAQTESNFQRRADLIPALVETVTRYMRYERETLSEVTNARTAASEELAASLDALIQGQSAASEVLRESSQAIEDEALMLRLVEAQAALRASVANVVAVSEDYPDLKSSDQFLELQSQLEGTENRINVARMRFNEAVGEFNETMRKLPWSLVASAGGFSRKAYLRSEEETRNAPELELD